MVTREQAICIMNKVKKNKPNQVFKNVSDLENGIKLVLVLLSESDGEVYASSISEKMHISRARVAVILKKMENKGLVERNPSSNDARIEVLKMTKKGLQELEFLQEGIIQKIIKLIDQLGYEKCNEFFDTAIKIKNILQGDEND